ncbi:MAG: hypothetical protein CBD51_001285 [Flavobacteriales bacterium TMED191]|nr:MAG: hypothetical protein CBD51_001285 [Flavobacteriales bacterium TMED191]
MKNYIFIICGFLLTCCDTIEPPFLQSNSQTSQKIIMIEKFTGHKCSNCPAATIKIKELQELYQDAIIPVSIHPGGLPEFTNTDNNYTYDFTTNSSNIIADDMGATFLPLGTVNRVEEGISNRCFTKDQWASEIENLLYDSKGLPRPKKFDIEISTIFNNSTRELTIETNVASLSSLQNFFKLAIIVIEDGIIAPQIDGTEYIENYEHNNIYRCDVNGTYGEIINDLKGLDEEFVFESSYIITLNQNLNSNWTNDWDNINNCFIVAYVYDAESLIIQDVVKKAIINE